MLEIKYLRENPNLVRKALTDRGGRSIPDFERILQKDKDWRSVLTELDQLRARRNKAADEIGRLKREKVDASSLLKEMDELKSRQKNLEEKERPLKSDIGNLLLSLPNLPDASVPFGKTPEDNQVVREVGKVTPKGFPAKDHHDLGTRLGILDFEFAAQLSGAGFAVYKGAGARLERSIANFMIDLHTKEHGYKEMATPFIVTAQTMTNTGQLPKFEEDLYKTSEDNLFLIPTSEVTLTNLFRDKVLTAEELPIAMTSLTPCFRREAGSYGKDTRGLIRNHQFTKVELVRACRLEDSLKELEILTGHAEEVLKRLEIPYRVVALCTADLGFAAAKTYDLEVWMPGENRWREISSCSTCTDFQARRMNFKVKGAAKEREWGCTLNGSGLAVGRTLAAILENNQEADGSIRIPKVLQSYFGSDKISI